MNSLNNSKCSLIDLLQNKWFSEVSITIIIHRQAKWLFWLWCLSQGERESSLVLLWRGCYISATMCESICDLPVLTTTLYLWSYVCDCLLPCCFCLQPPKFFFFHFNNLKHAVHERSSASPGRHGLTYFFQILTHHESKSWLRSGTARSFLFIGSV